MLKKGLFSTAAAFLAAVLLIMPVHAAPVTAAHCAIMMDADTGRVLYENRADQRSLIASTTKIMTALVVLEHVPLDTTFQIPPEASGIEGSSMYLKTGETLTVKELLFGMMLHSGNDAAIALALVCAGSVPEFVDLMNLKAQKLGLRNTHFENPNGLDGETHYSSARDLAKLTSYALANEEFANIVATKHTTAAGRTLTNHNRLLWSYEGCIGVKTGYTKAAGRILVSAAEREGRRLIVVTIHDGNDWKDHAQLYDYGFSLYETKSVVRAGDTMAYVPCMDGQHVSLVSEESVDYSVCDGEDVTIQVDYPQVVFSHGNVGTFAGTGSVYIGNKKIAVIRLLWGECDDRANSENHCGTRSRLSPCC